MPQDHKTDGEDALSNAERQARYRVRQAAKKPSITRYRRPADRRSRPQRWRAAEADLLALQTEYIEVVPVFRTGG